jgi:hypothetical protein
MKGLWNEDSKSDFKKESIVWEINHYDASAQLEIKNIDSLPEEDRYSQLLFWQP